MKTSLIACAAIVLSLSAATSLANNYKLSPLPVSAGKAFINMTGPNTISLSSGVYDYTVNLFGQPLASDAKWVITHNGNVVARYNVDLIVDGKAFISLTGADFGSTGTFTLLLAGTTDDGYGMIYGSKGITVTP
ncbi:hypothetical protein HGH92_06270 [Chitinophaga varians]|uniref:Uncharacterized protein n=1 Tax=Chitinophaga varians TaxID=2202339 RepID=A0A847RLR4_9BACT|nr:hypothetical protein [Chitinophaga varians]NLR63902.1 hypothetical protein [Chitinophaga varians]